LTENIIAMVFDFDDTLTDEAVSRFLRQKGVDVLSFWDKVGERVKQGWDISLAYLSLFVDMLKPGESLAGVSKKELARFGSGLKFYPGVQEMFSQLRDFVRRISQDRGVPFSIEFYIISGVCFRLLMEYLSGRN